MLSSPRPRVLYVDDDEDSREMLSTILRFSRIETKAVGTAAQALLLIQAERFELYMLDSRLPDLDGFELCRRMRDFDPITAILFFSGAADEAAKRSAIDAGADAYVIKPDIDGLLGNIMHFVSQAQSVSAAQVIPAGREVNTPLPLTYEIAGA